MAGIADATDEELSRYKQAIDAEITRRSTLRTAETQAAQLNADYLKASGVESGQEWRQPTSALDAYPKDWVVEYDGKQWVSLVQANVWIPGQSGWREVVDETSGPPEWVQPSGSHDAYQTGDRVTYQGAVYTSVIDGNVWAPDVYPQGWQEG